jgi:hypothetical protein
MIQTGKVSSQLEKKLIERFEKGQMSRHEFLEKSTDGLFNEKRRRVAARHEKYFGKKII